MYLSDVYNVCRINICGGNIDLDLINVTTEEKMSVRLNYKQPLRKIKPSVTSPKEIGNDIKYDESVFYSYTFNELHNDLLGDPIQLSSMEAEDSLVIGNFISIPAQLQQIYEFKEIK